MADTRQRTTLGNWFRFLVRVLGLMGFFAAVCGLSLLWAEFRNTDFLSVERLKAAGQGANGEFAREAARVLVAGGAVALLALAFELVSALFFSGGRRTAAGAVATLGVVAAVSLLVVVNTYSFTHYRRYDTTRDQRFTLPPDLATELGKLRASSPTTIVVLQKHRMFGTLTDERDSYTKAAEEKVTEKVRDLVDQFREFGPQFNVEVLDTEAFGYQKQLDGLTKDSPELKVAIETAPENSIFFHANKRVQRLSFNEFLQLDKTASKATEGSENLVLIPQGIDTFARRILAVQERRPKVAVCVVHELLTTAADDPENRFSLAGLRKSLTAQGFDVVDVVLKKGWNSARSINDLKPAADTREESKLERLEGELEDAETELTSARNELAQLNTILEFIGKLKARPWDERKAFYQRFIRGAQITEESEPAIIASITRSAKRTQDGLAELQKKKEEAEKKLAEALKDERPLQDRRMTDVSAKLAKQLADVDLLIVPRFTTEDAMKGPGVDATLHSLSKEQLKVAKDFMKRGKPVLACLGPITPQVSPSPGEPTEEFDRRLASEIGSAADGFERLLAERGVELGRSVILFEGETRSLAGGDPFAGGRPTDVPPLTLSEPPPVVFKITYKTFNALRKANVPEEVLAKLAQLNDRSFSSRERFAEEVYNHIGPDQAAQFLDLIVSHSDATLKPNPVAAAFRLTGRAAEQKLDIKLRAVRPVGIAPGWQDKQPFAAEIASTSPESWSELQPYPRFVRRPDGSRALAYSPKYEPLDLNDPKKGSRDEERRGPFTVGVAVENKVPAAWATEDLPLTDSAVLRSPYTREQAAAALLSPLDSTFAVGLTIAADKVERPTQRTVVFGSGTMFSGAELKPAQEKLLLHTVNWLTNREDRLPKPATEAAPEWHYPRVALSERTSALWQLAALPGLPVAAAVFGLFAMMRRRMR